MLLNEQGAAEKTCKRCGARMVIENWYAAIATKYCRSCAAEVHRAQTANALREARRKAAERRALERKRAALLAEENELLREQVLELERRVKKAR